MLLAKGGRAAWSRFIIGLIFGEISVNHEIKLNDNLFIEHGEAIEQVLQRAVRTVLLMHKRLGNPIAIWKDGEVVVVPAEQIAVDDSLDVGLFAPDV